MSDAPTKPISDTRRQDKDTLVSMVKEMTESMTGAQSTRHWAEDALWFDTPPFASRGIQPALKFFDKVFGSFKSCKVEILDTDAVVNGDMGLVCTIQRVSVVLKTGDRRAITAAKNLVNQVSLPSAGRLLDALNSFQIALTWSEAQQRVGALLTRGLQRDSDFERRWPEVLGTLRDKV